jgi:hypothetical protein
VLAPALVGRLEVSTGAFEAGAGRSLGGLVRAGTAELRSGLHASASADVTNASAFASLGDERARVGLAGEVGLLQPLLGPLLQGVARDRYPLPSSFDGQLKASFVLGERDTLDVLALASSDRGSRQLASLDPSLTRGRDEAGWFTRLGATWRHGEAAEGFTVTPFLGLDRQQVVLTGAAGNAAASAQTVSGGLRARSRTVLNRIVTLSAGVDALLSRASFSRSGPPGFPPREGDVVAFGEPISDDSTADAWRTTSLDAAAYLEAGLSLGALSLAPGLRLSAVSSDVSRGSPKVAATPPLGVSSLELLGEPRVNAAWAVLPGLSVLGSFGLAHQAPDGADQSVVFGNPALTAARGLHGALGVSVSAGVLAGEVTGYLRTSWGLAVRDTSAIPGVTTALLPTGEARAFGAQVLVRQRAWHGLSSSLGWTIGRSERRGDGAAAWRQSDFDQTHTLIAVLSQQLGAWRFGVRGRWATGAPRTEVLGSDVDLRRGVSQPIFGPLNGLRLPDFVQVDLDAAYTFALGAGSLELFVQVLNVTNHRNVEAYVYDSTFSTRGALLGLPLCATLGLRGGL